MHINDMKYHTFIIIHPSSSTLSSLAVRPHTPQLASLSATDRTKVMSNPILHYPANVPPVAALVAARICGVGLTEKPEKEWSSAASATLVFQDKAKLRGIPSILRYLARSSTTSCSLYGRDPVASTMVSLTREDTVQEHAALFLFSFLLRLTNSYFVTNLPCPAATLNVLIIPSTRCRLITC